MFPTFALFSLAKGKVLNSNLVKLLRTSGQQQTTSTSHCKDGAITSQIFRVQGLAEFQRFERPEIIFDGEMSGILEKSKKLGRYLVFLVDLLRGRTGRTTEITTRRTSA